jgi:hypothetical protein
MKGDNCVNQEIMIGIFLESQTRHGLLGLNVLGNLRRPDIKPLGQDGVLVCGEEIDGVSVETRH